MVDTLLVIVTIAFGALIQGAVGFGLGLFSMGVLAMLLPISDAVVTVAILGLFTTGLNLWTVRKDVVWRETWPILVTTVPATIAGTILLANLPVAILRRGVAVMILLGCGATIWSGETDRLRGPFPWAYVAGLVGGVFGGALNVGGPPGVVYTLLRGWDKERSKAILSAYLCASSVVRLPMHFVTGNATPQVLRRSLIVLPFSLAATYLGTRLFQRMSNRIFRLAALILLMGLAVRILIG